MWKKVLGIPGRCSFWEYEDGRLAITSGGRHPGEHPDWVDVNRPAYIDNLDRKFLVPILHSEDGRPDYGACEWGFISNVLRLTGLKLHPAHDGAQDEVILAHGFNELAEGRTSPNWTYKRREGDGVLEIQKHI